ncbi:MAG: gamma-glutamyltransferase [Gemmatimonadetes bacterium]|nr:gamma-glutamyltransferase [Gemmatimonadota bacterium]
MVVAALALAPLMSSSAADAQGAPLPVVGRSMVTTTLGIVASSSPLAAKAGTQILEMGGNAIDAAIAANAVIALTEPSGDGIGGDLFAIVYDARTRTLHGLNAAGWAPKGLNAPMLRAQGHTSMPRGIHTVTVPGAVSGWQALHDRFGTLGFPTLLAPAIHYAEHGFPVTEQVARMWGSAVTKLSANAYTRATFLLDGARAPKEGDVFRNPDLAKTLRRIAERGRDGFYTGPVADAIVRLSKEEGGTMALDDLRELQPDWVTPISTTYRGWTVSELPAPTQGIAALMMLNLMERFPVKEWGFHSTKAMHTMIEAKKLAYADMLRYTADPHFTSVPVAAMLDKSRAAERAKAIDPSRAACSVPPAQYASVSGLTGSETIYLTVVDKDGNIVSLIQSIYSEFGSGFTAPGTGVLLHNRGSLFSLDSTAVNVLAPRKRPLHTIIPAFMEKDGVRIGFGIMGGWNQSQAHAQFVSNIADYGMTLQQALEAGRFSKSSFDGCDVNVETLVPASVRAERKALGHDVRDVGPRSSVFGWGQAVMRLPDGVNFGASEPRHDGQAIPQGTPMPAGVTKAKTRPKAAAAAKR